MGKYRIEEPSSVTKSDHVDYKRNLENANKFVEKTKKSLLRGMDVKISDSQHLKKALLIISWSPGMTAPVGNCATPIFLHQPSSEVNRQIEGVFNAYMNSVGDYHKRHYGQLEFLPPDQKV